MVIVLLFQIYWGLVLCQSTSSSVFGKFPYCIKFRQEENVFVFVKFYCHAVLSLQIFPSTIVANPTFDNTFLKFSLDFLLQKWLEKVLEFPTLTHIFNELVCLCLQV